MNNAKTIKAPLTEAVNLVSELEESLNNALVSLEAAKLEKDSAASAYDRSLSLGREAARAAHQVHDGACVDCDVAQRTVELLSGRLDAARKDVSILKTKGLAEAARSKVREYSIVVEKELAAMTLGARRIARLWVEAAKAREEAIRSGAAESEVPGLEDFRVRPGRPREVIETQRVERWIHPFTGAPLSDEETASVHRHGASAVLARSSGAANGPISLQTKREFDREVYLKAEPGQRVPRLLESLFIPAVRAGEHLGWGLTPPSELASSPSPREVLRRLDELEKSPLPAAGDPRERVVELKPAAPQCAVSE